MFGEGEMLTNANTQISEPQNTPSAAIPDQQTRDLQGNTPTNTLDSEFTKTDSEKFSDTPTLFPYENGGESHDNLFGSTAADAQQFYVTTHEVIEFESGTSDQGTPLGSAPTDTNPSSAHAYNPPVSNSNPADPKSARTAGDDTSEKKADQQYFAPHSRRQTHHQYCGVLFRQLFPVLLSHHVLRLPQCALKIRPAHAHIIQ